MGRRAWVGDDGALRHGWWWTSLGLLLAMLGVASRAAALPSYSWQTGQPCAQCHVQAFGPALTSFGRQFKLNGYVWGDRPDVPFLPLAAMLQTSLTHTADGQPGGAAPHFNANNNVVLDQLSLFYAGRIAPHVGAFVQGTYNESILRGLPGFPGAGLARLLVSRHPRAAQRLGLGEDQAAAEGNRALGDEQRFEPFKRRREVRATQKT